MSIDERKIKICFMQHLRELVRAILPFFHTEQERNDWVNFKDEYSLAFGANKDNSSFERIPLDSGIAKKRIKTMLHKKDGFNDKQEWYIC